MEDNVALGGNIELSGFKDLDGSTMIVLKKIIGNYARRFSEICTSFEKLHVTMKKVHERETSEKYELHARVVDKGESYSSETIDRNLFVGIDILLKKIEKEIEKKLERERQ